MEGKVGERPCEAAAASSGGEASSSLRAEPE
jgi:hypothetical protein